MQIVYEIILLNKILKNHLLSEILQWSYVSFMVFLFYFLLINLFAPPIYITYI